jgi:hypothetical protein
MYFWVWADCASLFLSSRFQLFLECFHGHGIISDLCRSATVNDERKVTFFLVHLLMTNISLLLIIANFKGKKAGAMKSMGKPSLDAFTFI